MAAVVSEVQHEAGSAVSFASQIFQRCLPQGVFCIGIGAGFQQGQAYGVVVVVHSLPYRGQSRACFLVRVGAECKQTGNDDLAPLAGGNL